MNPVRWESESDYGYSTRCWRWKIWVKQERKDFWYTSDWEISEWRKWVESNKGGVS